MQYNTIQNKTIQYNTTQHSTIHYNTLQYIQYNLVQYKTMQNRSPTIHTHAQIDTFMISILLPPLIVCLYVYF